MRSRHALVLALVLSVSLAACSDDAGETVEDPTESSDGMGDEPAIDEPAVDPMTDGDAAAGGTQPAAIALTFDGQRVPIANACNTADGGVAATTEGEVTITLVRTETSVALRYSDEGMTAETDLLDVSEVGDFVVYEATLSSDDVPAVDVILEISDTSVLDDC